MKLLFKKILCFFTILGITSCSYGKSSNGGEVYLVTFESQDLGTVDFYLYLDYKEGKIIGGSKTNGYANTFNFADRSKINLFSGVKNKRLIHIEGIYEELNNVVEFHTAFFSPIGNYYFDGTINNNIVEGKILTKGGEEKGKIHGSLHNSDQNVVNDYKEITSVFTETFEKNFFDPKFLLTSNYKDFKEKINNYSSLAQDDLHYVFSMFYYLRSLPYSHIGLWSKSNDDKEKSVSNLFNYKKEGENGILTIESFTSTEGALDKEIQNIIKDNPKNLIIDLRNNSGGNIGPALELGKYIIDNPVSGGYFLTKLYYIDDTNTIENCATFSEGNLDAFMISLQKNSCVEIKLKPAVQRIKSKIYILTNNRTSSTCEPLVYALKQNDNITVVGTRTAGKMLSSKEFHIKDNYSMFIPIADYLTNDNKRLDQKGVEPDIEVKTDALEYVLKL